MFGIRAAFDRVVNPGSNVVARNVFSAGDPVDPNANEFDDDDITLSGVSSFGVSANSSFYSQGHPLGDPQASTKLAISPVLSAYCSQDRADVRLPPAAKEMLRLETRDKMPDDLVREAIARYNKTEVILITGLLNFFPTDRYANRLAAVFGGGLTVIGTARNNSRSGERGLYSYIGGDERVLQKNWMAEVAIVIDRLALSFGSKPPAALAGERIILGHSKGGLVAKALMTLRDHYDYVRDDGTFPGKYYRLYPGLKAVRPEKIRLVMSGLQNARFVGLGTPIEGIPDGFMQRGLVRLINRAVLSDIGSSFTADVMRYFHAESGQGPEEMDLLLTSRVAHESGGAAVLEGGLMQGMQHGWLGAVIHGSGNAFFNSAGRLFYTDPSDGLVPTYGQAHPNHAVLDVALNHLQQIERRGAAESVLRALLEKLP